MKKTLNDQLFEAVYVDRTDKVEGLLSRGADVNARHLSKSTPLYYATCNGNLRLMRLLLEKGGDPDLMGDYGAPLHTASRSGALAVMRLLIDHGADVSLAEEDFMMNTPIHEAIYGKKPKAVALLLAAGADVEKRNGNGFTARTLHQAWFGRALPRVAKALSGTEKAKRPSGPALERLATGKDARLFEHLVAALVEYVKGHHAWASKQVGAPYSIEVGWDVPELEGLAPIDSLGITVSCEPTGDEERAQRALEKKGYEGSPRSFWLAFGMDALVLQLPKRAPLEKLARAHPRLQGFFRNESGERALSDYSPFSREGHPGTHSELDLWIAHLVATAVDRAGRELGALFPDCEITLAGHDGSGPRPLRAKSRSVAALRKEFGYRPDAKFLRAVFAQLVGTPSVLDKWLAIAGA